MKRFSWMVVCLAVLLPAVGPIDAMAQMSEQDKAEVEKLQRFVGEWVAKEAGFESTSGKATFEMTLKAEPVVSGRAVEFVVAADIAEIGEYREKDFLVFDPMEKKVALMAVSSFGEAAMYTGGWDDKDENVLRLSTRKTAQGKELLVEVAITFTDDDEFTWKVRTVLDGEQVGRFWATFEED